MKRMHAVVGTWTVVVALGLASEARAQDVNPVGDSESDRTLADVSRTASAADDDPFGAAAQAPVDPFGAPPQTPVQGNHRAADRSGSVQSKPASSDARVRAALASPTKMEFTEMPLIDAVEYLKDHHGIEIQLDNRVLEDAGVGSDTPVTRNLNGLPLDASLRLLLGEYNLAYLVRDGVLMITTQDAAHVYLELKVYDVTQSIGADAKPAEVGETLALLRQSTVVNRQRDPASADNFTVVPFRNLLIIRASQHDHDEIEKLFTEIRSKLKPSN